MTIRMYAWSTETAGGYLKMFGLSFASSKRVVQKRIERVYQVPSSLMVISEVKEEDGLIVVHTESVSSE